MTLLMRDQENLEKGIDLINLSEGIKNSPHESSNPLTHAVQSLENIRFSRDFCMLPVTELGAASNLIRLGFP